MSVHWVNTALSERFLELQYECCHCRLGFQPLCAVLRTSTWKLEGMRRRNPAMSDNTNKSDTNKSDTNKSDTNKSDSQPPSRSESVDGSGFSDAQEGLAEDYEVGKGQGERASTTFQQRTLYFPSTGYRDCEPLGLTNLTPTKEEVFLAS